MAGKSRIEELSVVADPWNLKLKPASEWGSDHTNYVILRKKRS